jgi:hypothetical protein
MAKGRRGFQLEAWKFSVYIAIPIMASWWFSDPLRQKQAADYYKYVQYPANPNTNMKEQIEQLQKQQEQHKIYREQLKELNRQAKRSNESLSEDSPKAGGWLRWIGLGGSGKEA